jgi:hypothetical protein
MDNPFKNHRRKLISSKGICQQIYPLAILLKEISFTVNRQFIKMTVLPSNWGGKKARDSFNGSDRSF